MNTFDAKTALTPVLVLLAAAALGGAPRALAAGPRYWDWPEGRSFDEITLEGAGRDTLGGLSAGPVAVARALEGPEIAWRLVADGRGGWFAGTGHAGEIHQVAADGTSRVVARLESTEIFSLAVLPGGDLLAGGGPDGRLARVTRAGDVTEVGRVEGSFVWAIVVQEKAGAAWLATGTPAAIYRYTWRDGRLTKVADLPAQNAMDVALDDRGGLLVATQGPGLVWRLATTGEPAPRLLGDIAQDEARRLLRGPQGAFHVLGLAGGAEALATPGDSGGDAAAVAHGPPPLRAAESGAVEPSPVPAAALYRVGDDGTLTRVWAGERELLTAAWSARWGWVGAGTLIAGGDGAGGDSEAPTVAEARATAFRLTAPYGVAPLCGWSGGDVLDIVAAGDGLALAQAHPAAVVLAGADGGGAAFAVGPPLDGGPGVAWGRLRWEGVPGEGSARWSVRGGRQAQPDETWTAWSAPWSEADHALEVVDCRYLQWRVELPAAAPGRRAWSVTGVSVSARQANLPPVIEEFRLEQLRGVKLGGLNAGESIVHEYRSGLRAEFTPQDAPGEGWAPLERTDPGRAVRVMTWRATDPNRDRLEFRLECRREDDARWLPAVTTGGRDEPLTGNLGSWDTSGFADGRYLLRLVASDGPDNAPADTRRAERVLGPLTVDNTPPTLTVEETARARGGDLTVRVQAVDGTSPLAAARLLLPDGQAEPLAPRDGICDSARESFVAVVDAARAVAAAGGGPLRARLEVRDLAGNIAGIDVVWP